jgi:hypothetical protein
MDWSSFADAIISILFEILTAVASVFLIPIDFLINVVVPGASGAAQAMFDWMSNTIGTSEHAIEWFFYVIGVTPATFHIMSLSFKAVFLVFLIVTPVKVVLGIFRGMRS